MDMSGLQQMPSVHNDRDEEFRQQHHSSDESTIEEIHEKEETNSEREYTTTTTSATTKGAFGEAGGNAVNIENAISNYEELRRELTTQSRLSRVKSNHAPDMAEKGDAKDFDLTDFLGEQHDQETNAGMHPKHMGLIWKDLVVKGLGADAKIIPILLSLRVTMVSVKMVKCCLFWVVLVLVVLLCFVSWQTCVLLILISKVL